MSLLDSVAAAFRTDSSLAQMAPGFRPRQGQLDMAMAVARTLEHGSVLVVEAGTGVGKTFAYLVPALLSGQRILLSTATKTLQDQLFGRDLPLLMKGLGVQAHTALLKGRSSYLCLHRMKMAREEGLTRDALNVRTLAKIEKWALTTHTGDLAELPGLDERSAIIPLVTSTRENCLGSDCPSYRTCHVNLARREAMAADLVVVNHHLFFADIAVRESGRAELLPSVDVAIFDEAHQINEIGVQFLGLNLTSGHLLDFARDLLAAGLQHARGLVDWQEVVAGVEFRTRDLRLVVGKTWSGTKLRWIDAAPEGLATDEWQAALIEVALACETARAHLETVTELAPDFPRLLSRANTLAEKARQFLQPCAVDAVRWLDVSAQIRLIESPLDIAKVMQSRLLQRPQEPAVSQSVAPLGASTDAWDDESEEHLPGEGRPSVPLARSWIFTSATLGDDARMSWFTQPCGLDAPEVNAEILKVDSPFDYPRQASVYVPSYLPKPNDPSHSSQVAQLVAQAARVLGGRTLVLTTTLRALRTIGEMLQSAVEAEGQLQVLVQGQLPKRELIDRFRGTGGQGADAGQGCILVASASFWEGVDVPGDALQLVVIDKLPFPPPGDPLVEARSKRIEALGASPFNHYFVPEAAIALKQGAGRLIRRESDQGILMLCDTRLTSMSYGKRLLAALPPMRMMRSVQEFDAALFTLRAAHDKSAVR